MWVLQRAAELAVAGWVLVFDIQLSSPALSVAPNAKSPANGTTVQHGVTGTLILPSPTLHDVVLVATAVGGTLAMVQARPVAKNA